MEQSAAHKIGLDSFIIGEQLGEGAYSKVFFCKKKDDNQYYAVKIVNKSFIQKEDKVRSVMSERNALLRFHHPLISRLHYSFQDAENLYFVIQYAPGGDLSSMIKDFKKNGKLCPFSVVQFYVAEILLALDYIHNQQHAVHRDLKPENVLLQESGHISLTDFGTILFLDEVDKEPEAKQQKRGRGYTFCGSSSYISPEVLDGGVACPASDLWALGCIIYQLVTGSVLFADDNDYLIFEKIAAFSADTFPFPSSVDRVTKDLICRLLVKDPIQRLGATDYKDLFNHPFFKGIDFNSISESTAPYQPPKRPLPSLSTVDAAFEASLAEDIAIMSGALPAKDTHSSTADNYSASHHESKPTPNESPMNRTHGINGIHGTSDAKNPKDLKDSKDPNGIRIPIATMNQAVNVGNMEQRREQAFTEGNRFATPSPVVDYANPKEKLQHTFLDTSEEILYNGVLLKGRCFAGAKHYLFLTSKPRLFCFNARNGKLVLNINVKEIANVKYITEKSFSFEDLVNHKVYCFRTAQGDVRMWVDTINSMIHYVNGEK